MSAHTKQAYHRARAALRNWNTALLQADADRDVRNGTRWGRAGIFLLPTVLSIGGLGSLMAQGVLAAGFNVTNTAFTLTSNGVTGSGFGAVLNTPTVEAADGSTSTNIGMARVSFSSAQLAGLCGIVHQKIAGLQYSLIITAGQDVAATAPTDFTTDIDASNLSLETTGLKASATSLTNAVLGASADEVKVGGAGLAGAVPGGFGLDASQGSVSIAGLNATAYTAEIAGTLGLPGLELSVVAGSATHC